MNRYETASTPLFNKADATEIPAELRELVEDLQVEPTDIPSLAGELDTEAKARLQDLGYIE